MGHPHGPGGRGFHRGFPGLRPAGAYPGGTSPADKSDRKPAADVPPDPDWPTFAAPSEIVLFRNPRGVPCCTLRDQVSFPSIHLYRAFPVSARKGYLAITDAGGKHVALIPNAHELDPASRRLAEHELWRRYVVPKISDILSIRERLGVAEWHVVTDRGETKFTVRNVRENVREVTPGRYVISDSEGNRYDIEDVSSLPRRARILLESLR